MKTSNKNPKLLLICLALDKLFSIFIYTYVLAFLFNVSNNGIVSVTLLYLIIHSSMLAFSWILGPLFKRIKKTRIFIIGITFRLILVTLIIMLKEKISSFIFLIAIINGLAEISFWSGANPLIPILTDKTQIRSFLSYSGIVGTTIHIVIPPIMAYFIDAKGLEFIAIIMCFVVAMQLMLSLLIKTEHDIDGTKLNYKTFLNTLKENHPIYKQIYINEILYGICSNVPTIILYYTILTFGTNMSLGIFSTISAIITIILLFIFNQKPKYFSTKTSAIIASILVAINITLITIKLNKVILIILHLLWNICIIVPRTLTETYRLNIIQQKNLVNFNMENNTITESLLDFGRIIGEILLIIMGIVNTHLVNIICLYIILGVIIVYFLHTAYLKKQIKT